MLLAFLGLCTHYLRKARGLRQAGRQTIGCLTFFRTVLEDLVSKGDAVAFEEFKQRVANHGLAPQPGQASYNGGGGATYRSSAMPPGHGAKGPMPGAQGPRSEYSLDKFDLLSWN